MGKKCVTKSRWILLLAVVALAAAPMAHAEDPDPTNLVPIPDPSVFLFQAPQKINTPRKPQVNVHFVGQCEGTPDVSTDAVSRESRTTLISGVVLVDEALPILDDTTGGNFSQYGTTTAETIGGTGGCVYKNEAGGGDPGGGVTVECWAIDKTWTNNNKSGSVAYAFRMQLSWCGDGSKITEITYNNAFHAGGFWYFEGSSAADTGIGQSTSSINDDWRYTWEEYGANMWRNPRVDATIDAFGRMSGTVYWG